MLLHIDGFSSYSSSSSSSGLNIDSELIAAGYGAFNNIWSMKSYQSGGPRGGKCLALEPGGIGASHLGGIQRTFTSTASKIAIGFAFCLNVVPPGANLIKFFSVGDLSLASIGGLVHINDVPTALTLPADSWVYFEVEIDKATGQAAVFVDTLELGTAAATVGDTFTCTLGSDSFTAPYGRPQGSEKYRYADLYILDGSGARNNARLGPQQINPRLPTADVSKSWLPSNGSADNFSVVGTSTPSTASYLSSTVDGATDRYSSANPVAGATVNGVSIVMLARKTDTGNKALQAVLGADESAVSPLTQTFVKKFFVFNDPPAAGPLAATEFGMKVATSA